MSIEALLLTLLGSIRRSAHGTVTREEESCHFKSKVVLNRVLERAKKARGSLLDLVPCGLVVSETNSCFLPARL